MTTPAQVPDLWRATQDYLDSSLVHEYVGDWFYYAYMKQKNRTPDGMPTMPDNLPQEYWGNTGIRWSLDQKERLNISTMFHVSEPMMAVIKMAGDKLSDHDDIWGEHILPALNGSVVFEVPIYMIDNEGWRIAVKAVTWKWWEGHLHTAYFSPPNDEKDDYAFDLNEKYRGKLGPLHLVHASAYGSGEDLGPSEAEIREAIIQHAEEERPGWGGELQRELYDVPRSLVGNMERFLYSMFLMMDQTIVEVTEYQNHKQTKMFARRKIKLPTKVTVMRLRRAEQTGKYERDSQGTNRFLLYRSPTRGHWRWQSYGPGRTEQKRIWIHLYWRGPEDAPIWVPDRVSSLSR